MNSVPEETILAAIDILGTPGMEEDELERAIRGLVGDDMTARRLFVWIREAFGLVLISHLRSKPRLPTTFSARNREGRWVELELTGEPIFTAALLVAQRMFHEGPRETFQAIALRSAMLNAVNNLLNAGSSLEGARLSGLALIDIPAEVYVAPRKPFWRRGLFR